MEENKLERQSVAVDIRLADEVAKAVRACVRRVGGVRSLASASGVSASTISRCSRGENVATLEMLWKIGRAARCTFIISFEGGLIVG